VVLKGCKSGSFAAELAHDRYLVSQGQHNQLQNVSSHNSRRFNRKRKFMDCASRSEAMFGCCRKRRPLVHSLAANDAQMASVPTAHGMHTKQVSQHKVDDVFSPSWRYESQMLLKPGMAFSQRQFRQNETLMGRTEQYLSSSNVAEDCGRSCCSSISNTHPNSPHTPQLAQAIPQCSNSDQVRLFSTTATTCRQHTPHFSNIVKKSRPQSLLSFLLVCLMLMFTILPISPSFATYQLYSIGSNTQGQLGDNSQTDRNDPYSNPPKIVQHLTDLIIDQGQVTCFDAIGAISTGMVHSSVTTTQNGLAYGFGGQSTYGNLGDGTDVDRWLPVRSSGLLNQTQVTKNSAGSFHTIFLANNGKLYGTGKNVNYQLGDGSALNRFWPVEVDMTGVLAGVTIVDISAGGDHNLVIDNSGNVYGWGSNGYGQIGDKSFTDRSAPVSVDTTGDLSGKILSQISAGHLHSFLLSNSGEAFCAGANDNGQCGDGSAIHKWEYGIINGGALSGKTVSKVSAGVVHTLFLSSDNLVFGTGVNTNGQLGDGSTTSTLSPVQMDTTALGALTVVSIAANNGFSVVLISNGSVFGTGGKYVNQVGLAQFNTNGLNIVKISRGYGDHSLLLASCPDQSATMCNSKGVYTCDGVCHCCTGYVGASCNDTLCYGIPGSDTANVCSQRGTCTEPNQCECDAGYYGADCSVIYECFGHYSNDSTACSSQGNCTASATCSCQNGFSGDNCEIPSCFGVAGNETSSVCSGSGSCLTLDVCTCSTGYHGSNCEFSEAWCFGIVASNATVCSGHGTCVADNSCSCNSSYSGTNCSTLCEVDQYYCSASGAKTLCGNATTDMVISLGALDWSSWLNIPARNISSFYAPCGVVSHEWNLTSLFSALLNNSGVVLVDSPHAASDSANVYSKAISIAPYHLRFDSTHHIEARIILANGQVITEVYEVQVMLQALVISLNMKNQVKVYSHAPVQVDATSSHDPSHCSSSPQWSFSSNNGQSHVSYSWACYDYFSGESCAAPSGSATTSWTLDPAVYGVTTAHSSTQVKVLVLNYMVSCLGTIRISAHAIVAELVYGSPPNGPADGTGETYQELRDRLTDIFSEIDTDDLGDLPDEDYAGTTDSLWNFVNDLLNSNATKEEKEILVEDLVDEVTDIIEDIASESRPESTCQQDKMYSTLLLLERVSTLSSLLSTKSLNILNAYVWGIRGVCNPPELQMLMNITEFVMERSQQEDIEMDQSERMIFDSFVVRKNTFSLCASARDIRSDTPYYAESVYETQNIFLKLEKKRVSEWNMDTCTATLKSSLFGPKSVYYSPSVATSKEGGGMSVSHILRAERWRDVTSIGTRSAQEQSSQYDTTSVTVPHSIDTLGAHWFASESNPGCLEAREDDAKSSVTWKDSTDCNYNHFTRECDCVITTLEHGTLDLYGSTIIAVGLSQLSTSGQTWVVIVFTVSLALTICLITLCIMCCVSMLLRLASTSIRIMDNYRNKQLMRRQIHDYSDFAQKKQVSKDDIMMAWSPKAGRYSIGTKQQSLDKLKKLYEINHGVLRASRDDLYKVGVPLPGGVNSDDDAMHTLGHRGKMTSSKHPSDDMSFGTLDARSNSFDTLSA